MPRCDGATLESVLVGTDGWSASLDLASFVSDVPNQHWLSPMAFLGTTRCWTKVSWCLPGRALNSHIHTDCRAIRAGDTWQNWRPPQNGDKRTETQVSKATD